MRSGSKLTVSAIKRVAATSGFCLLAFAWVAFPVSSQAVSDERRSVSFEARMTQFGSPIEKGVEWRIYSTAPSEDGSLPLIAFAGSDSGTSRFDLEPGEYMVRAAYGYASVARRVEIKPLETRGRERVRSFVFNAGGLLLSGALETGDRIASHRLRFDIHRRERGETGDGAPIGFDLEADRIYPLPEGTWRIVSRYGDVNAETRADLRVEAGQVTQAEILHRAAHMRFRLVERSQGEAIAGTAWSILDRDGRVLAESSSAFPDFILAEGEYVARARNSGKEYSREFRVTSGINQEIELFAE